MWFHIETFHDTKCGDCISFCDNKCSIDFAREVELRDERVMEAGLAEKAEAAVTAAEDLERCIKKKVKLYTPLAVDMTRLLDTGFDGPEAAHWSRIIYLPAPKISEKPLSEKVKEWVKLTELESAFDEQTKKIQNTEVRECPIPRCRASVFNEWEHRWNFHPDTSSRYWRSGSEASFMTNIRTLASADESSPKWQSKQTRKVEEEREKDPTKAATMMQKDSAENSENDPQSIFASNNKDNLRPIFEITLERKIADTTEPLEPEADLKKKKKKMETISSPLMEVQKMRPDPNIQKRESDSSSVRMEKFGKTEPHEPEADSEKRRKKMKTIKSPLM